MRDFSQSGEQAVILKYFPDWQTVPRSFLDVGANDGLTFSNSYLLASIGAWRGVCVEPSWPAFVKLQKTHEGRDDRVLLVNAAITEIDGPIDFYDSGTHLHQGDVALLSTTVPAELDRWKKSGEQFTKTTVRGITFATLMKECAQREFQFITIDAEGADYAILAQIDLTAVGCQMLCIEFNQRADDRRKMSEHCAKHEMRLHAQTYENLIFAR